MVDAVQLALGRVIRDAALAERLASDPHGTLAELGLDEPTRELLLAFGVGRLVAYNAMVRSRLLRTVREFSPRACMIVGDRLPALVYAWIAERGPSSPYLREIPSEFFAWARPHWVRAIAAGELPAWLIELFEHELEQRELVRDPRATGQPSPHPVALALGMVANPTARLVRREYAVHRLPAKLDPELPPEVERAAFVLAAWRDRGDKARVLELRPRHAALLERLLAGASLQDALFGACAAVGEALDDVILGDTAVTLATWCDNHLLLGGVAGEDHA
jgi:hypothetical protein